MIAGCMSALQPMLQTHVLSVSCFVLDCCAWPRVTGAQLLAAEGVDHARESCEAEPQFVGFEFLSVLL